LYFLIGKSTIHKFELSNSRKEFARIRVRRYFLERIAFQKVTAYLTKFPFARFPKNKFKARFAQRRGFYKSSTLRSAGIHASAAPASPVRPSMAR